MPGSRTDPKKVMTLKAMSTTRMRATFVLGSAAFYVLTYLAVHHILGNATDILSTVPVIIAGWLFGFRGGFVAGMLAPFVNMLLVFFATDTGVYQWLAHGGALGSAALVLVGAATGRLRDLGEQAKSEWKAHIRAEGALRETEELYRAVVVNAIDAIVINDGSRVMFCNQAFLMLHGFRDSGEAIGQALEKFVLPEDREMVARNALARRRGRQPPSVYEYRLRRVDGQVRTVQCAVASIVYQGRPASLAILRDVTERRRAEEELRMSEARFRRLVENAGDAFFLCNLHGRILHVNQRACQVLGYTREELLRLSVGDVETARLHNDLQETWEQLESGPITVEGVHRRKDGTTFPVEVRVCSIGSADGPAVLCLARDITERKVAEEVLKQSASDLQLSNLVLEQYASVAAHDLQEPLRKIQIFGDRLRAKHLDALDAAGRDYLDRMQGAARRMSTLINDLLMLSRVTSQGRPFVPVNLHDVARDTVSDLEAHIEEVGARVTICDLPVVDADPTQMRQLLQNLISNSLKFHRTGEAPIVKVEGRIFNGRGRTDVVDATARDWVQICVEDNGIGFDEKHLDRIFKLFQRLHGRGRFDGTGVGLAICRRIVERHAGTITAKSTLGRGSTFVVSLPRNQDTRGGAYD